VKKKITKDLFEIRMRHKDHWRSIYAYIKGDTIIIVSLFKKKSNQIPIKELKKAYRRLLEYKKNKNLPPLIPLAEWSKQFTKEELTEARKRLNYHQTVKYYKIIQNLKSMRKELGLTQQQVADKAQINRIIIAKVESGQRNTTLNTLMKIAQAMGKELKIDFV